MSRIEGLVSTLHDFYGPLTPPPRDPFRLFVWEVLSSHTAPARRDAALSALRRARALTPDALSKVPRAKLEAAVALTGSHVEPRLSALKAGVDLFRSAPNLAEIIRGPLPAARRALKLLPRLNDGGASRMLLFAADHLVLPMDAGTLRVAERLGYGQVKGRSRALMRSARQAVCRELHDDLDLFRTTALHLLHHAATTCTERDPHCRVCPLLPECPHGQTLKARF